MAALRALLGAALLATALWPAAAALPTKGSLAGCLRDAGIDTQTGADDGYYEARQVFSLLFRFWPAAVAYPNSTDDVAAAIKCARKWRVDVRPRCGGHGNEGESVAAMALTLDLTRLNAVNMSADARFVSVGGGARIGEIVAGLWTASNGTRGFPAGQRPTVGVGGFTLGGGFGGLTRWAGLAADNLLAVTAVDGQGRVVRADADSHPELLWACRGGGGGRFVVVTEFVFRTVDVSTGVTEMTAVAPPELAAEALAFFQTWQQSLSPRFTARADYTNDTAGGRVSVELGAWCMGGKALCVGELQASLPTEGALAKALEWKVNATDLPSAHTDSYLDAAVAGIGWPVPYGLTPLQALAEPTSWDADRSYYKYKSFILRQPLPPRGVDAVLEYAASGPAGTRVFEFQTLGGAMAGVPTNGTAAEHLHAAQACLIMRANAGDLETAEAALHNATIAIQRLTKLAAHPYAAYINFLDTDVVSSAGWERAYFGSNAGTLACVDAKYDPTNLFKLPLDSSTDRHPPTPEDCAAALAEVGAAAAAWSRYLESHAPARYEEEA